PSVTKTEASPSTISPKPFIKFVKGEPKKLEQSEFPTVRLGVKKGRPCPKNNCSNKSMTPRTVIHKPYRPPIRPVRPNMNVAQPKKTSFHKLAHSYSKRPFQRTLAVRSEFRALWIPTVNRKISTVNRKFPTVNRKFSTGSTKFSTADMGKKGNAGNSQNHIDDKGYWDSGCSRHMTSNISYLSDYEPFDGGYVSFGQGGCKITGKGTIKIGKLEFENMYFVKDLKDFKLIDDTNVMLRTPRQHNIYSIDLNNIVPHKDLTCLVAKASADECMLWHRRLGHLNFKTMNRISHKWYCLVVTDDFSWFTWTFFLKTKDETSGILRKFITEIENLKDLKVKIIRCDNGGEFRNKEMNDLCSNKGNKREFSNARTPQQNGVAERRNRTLIEAGRTMLADAKLPVTFWAKAVNTACYVQNKDLVNKSQNKTPYELFNGKFEAKGDEGYFIRYFMSSKAFRVFNKRTKRVEENLHVDFLENKLIEKEVGPNWLFNIDSLTNSMNYVPVVVAGINSTNFLGTKDAASQEVKKDVSSLRYIALPNWVHDALLESPLSLAQDTCKANAPESSGNPNPTASTSNPLADQMETLTVETPIPTLSSLVPNACFEDSPEPTTTTRIISKRVTSQDETPSLDTILALANKFEDILEVTTNSDDTHGEKADIGNMETTITASPTPTLRIHKEHPKRHTQEEGIDYDEVFAPVARIKAVRLFLAYASFMGFTVYQMDVKSAFLYGDILKKFGYSDVRSSNTPMDKENPWGKYETRKDVDLHLYRSMIGSLMYLTASRPDIMFAVCACARHQVTPKECHLHAVNRIFRYLKGHPKLGLWYPKESFFDLVAYSDSDYGGATQDRKSTTEGCQFLGRRLISWQCKK
nr:hypothetical protein [Tanacetum cinerariifolium]